MSARYETTKVNTHPATEKAEKKVEVVYLKAMPSELVEFKEEKPIAPISCQDKPIAPTSCQDTTIYTNMIGAVLNELHKSSQFYRTYAYVPGTVVYGSIIWRIILCVDKLARDAVVAGLNGHADEKAMLEKQSRDPSTVLKIVLLSIATDDADIDMFVSNSVKFHKRPKKRQQMHAEMTQAEMETAMPERDVDYGFPTQYGWLAYRYEAKVLSEMKKEIRTLSEDSRSLLELTMKLQVLKEKARKGILPDVRTISTTHQVGEFRIKFQIHQSSINEPEILLNEYFAPFFTAESLMWVSGSGVSARFGLDLTTVIRDIQRKEMHIICAEEIFRYFEPTHGPDRSAAQNIMMQKLERRLCKYKRYGFTLKLDDESAKCVLIGELIDTLMISYIKTSTPSQKREIAAGLQPTFAKTVITDERDYEWAQSQDAELEYWAEMAQAAQALHDDFVAGHLEMVSGLPDDLTRMIAGYATRSNEVVYHEDPEWRATIETERATIEQARQTIAEMEAVMNARIREGP